MRQRYILTGQCYAAESADKDGIACFDDLLHLPEIGEEKNASLIVRNKQTTTSDLCVECSSLFYRDKLQES